MSVKNDRQRVIDMLRRQLTQLDLALDEGCENDAQAALQSIAELHEQLQKGEVE